MGIVIQVPEAYALEKKYMPQFLQLAIEQRRDDLRALVTNVFTGYRYHCSTFSGDSPLQKAGIISVISGASTDELNAEVPIIKDVCSREITGTQEFYRIKKDHVGMFWKIVQNRLHILHNCIYSSATAVLPANYGVLSDVDNLRQVIVRAMGNSDLEIVLRANLF
jgi:hypothetical protein